MEIVAIEAQTFDRMLQRLKDMARITDEICKMHGERKIGGGWTARMPAFGLA